MNEKHASEKQGEKEQKKKRKKSRHFFFFLNGTLFKVKKKKVLFQVELHTISALSGTSNCHLRFIQHCLQSALPSFLSLKILSL